MSKLLPIFLLFPLICHAEVMDKEPSFIIVVLFSLIGSIAAYTSARYKPWLLIAVLAVFGFLAFGQLSDVTDSFVGLAIKEEADRAYVLLSLANPILLIVFTTYGLLLGGTINQLVKH